VLIKPGKILRPCDPGIVYEITGADKRGGFIPLSYKIDIHMMTAVHVIQPYDHSGYTTRQ
jgi:hypothetical protein